MADTQLGSVLRHLRKLAGSPVRELTDRELLERFAARHEEAAFTALVRRHGQLVWGVCRHVLHHDQDAEDAMQATFLVLARRAGTVRKAEALSSWLHGVAYRVAMTAKRSAARRRAQEIKGMRKTSQEAPTGLLWQDVQAILDEEVQRLPESQRAPVVLCLLEGRSRAEAAQELGVKEGTVSSRLARARRRLQQRLARRGVTLSGILLAAGLTKPAAAVPCLPVGPLLRAALQPAPVVGISAQAASLTETVLKAMPLNKLTARAVLVLALTVLAAGAGVLAHHSRPADPPRSRSGTDSRAPASEPRRPQPDPVRRGRTDRHGDPLPPEAVARVGTVRLRHGGRVTCVAFAPGGKLLATGGYDNAVAVWDVATGKERARLTGHQTGIEAVAFSADGRLLASGGGGPYGKGGEVRMVRVWDVARAKEVSGFGKLGVTVRSLAFSRDRKTLAAGFADHTVRLLEVATGKELAYLPGKDSRSEAALSPDARHAAWGVSDRTVIVCELATGKETLRLKDLPDAVTALAFAPDGKTLAAGSADGGVRLYDPGTGKLLGRLSGPRRETQGVVFLPGGKSLAAWGDAASLRLWDLATGKHVDLPKRGAAIAFAPDGKTVAFSNDKQAVQLWDLKADKPARRFAAHDGGVAWVGLTADGKTLATFSPAERSVRLWDSGSGAALRQIGLGGAGNNAVALSGDGKTLAAAGFTWSKPRGGVRPGLRLVDVAGGKRRFSLPGHRRMVCAVAFSPDGKTLASGGDDRSILLWDVAAGKQFHNLRGHEGAIGALAFSPDGQVLASAGNGPNGDESLRLWDVATGKLLHRIRRGYCDTSSVAFSPDGRSVAVAAGEQAVGLWEVATGQRRLTLIKKRGWWVHSVAFSPDGNFLAAGLDSDVCLWSLRTGREVHRFTGHRGAVASLVFTPDGKRLISGSSDTTALVWDLGAVRRAGRAQPKELESGEAEKCWADLGGGDAARAYQAVLALAAAPRQAVPFLQKKLPSVRALTARREKEVLRRIGELDSGRFAVRRKAFRELEALGEAARPALQKALSGQPSVERREQLEHLLRNITGGGRRLQTARALEALERAGTPEARKVLAALGRGIPEAWLTREARAALRRLGR
jgi:RNA polymerase sigma factor (sigma-70 family)